MSPKKNVERWIIEPAVSLICDHRTNDLAIQPTGSSEDDLASSPLEFALNRRSFSLNAWQDLAPDSGSPGAISHESPGRLVKVA
jgi:hypothetical protein